MPDFSDSAYVSYVQLCRELGREWECQMCSGFGRIAHDKVEGESYNFVDCPFCSGSGRLYPTLADWLEMLEEKLRESNEQRFAFRLQSESGKFDAGYLDSGEWYDTGWFPTREEAAARLYVAVTQ